MLTRSAAPFVTVLAAVGCVAGAPVTNQSAPPAAPAAATPRPPLLPPSPSPSPPIVFEQPRPQLSWDYEAGLRTFGEPGLVRGDNFAPGRYTVWIGPPRAAWPSCVPDDAVPLETVTVDKRGTFSHGFTLRESWGSWSLRRNDFFRLYAAPGDSCVAACPEALKAVVDESTRTVSIESATFRPMQSCLGIASEADLETSFVPASSGVYTVRGRVVEVGPNSPTHAQLTFGAAGPSGTGWREAFSTVVVQ